MNVFVVIPNLTNTFFLLLSDVALFLKSNLSTNSVKVIDNVIYLIQNSSFVFC